MLINEWEGKHMAVLDLQGMEMQLHLGSHMTTVVESALSAVCMPPPESIMSHCCDPHHSNLSMVVCH